MTTFLTLSAKQSKGLDVPLIENAQILYNDALLIAEINKSYSKATSILILGLEEAIKAILVKLHSEELKIYKVEGIQIFVKDHKIRHQVAQLIETGSGLVEVYEKWQKSKQTKPKFKKKWLNNMANGLQAGMQFYNSALRIEKLKEFNDIKNKGFYVNYLDEIQQPNLMVLEKDYNEVKAIVDRILNFYRIIKIIYEPQSIKSDLNKRNEYLKLQIQDFINNILLDFSFKKLSSKN